MSTLRPFRPMIQLPIGDQRNIVMELISADGFSALGYWTGRMWAHAPMSANPRPLDFKPARYRLLDPGEQDRDRARFALTAAQQACDAMVALIRVGREGAGDGRAFGDGDIVRKLADATSLAILIEGFDHADMQTIELYALLVGYCNRPAR